MGEVLPESGIRNPVRESGFGKRFGSAARELTEREERLIEHKVRKKREKEREKKNKTKESERERERERGGKR
jgi:hypothetical protein